MPTQIIRPDGTNAQSGMNPASNIHGKLNDNDDNTFAFQNNTSAIYKLALADTSGLGSATIEKFVLSFRGAQDRRPGATVVAVLIDAAGQVYSDITFGGSGFTGTTTTYDSSDITTQQDGSTALDASYLDGLNVNITPSADGHKVFEVFVTITYSEGYGNKVIDVRNTNIGQVIGISTANISKVIGV